MSPQLSVIGSQSEVGGRQSAVSGRLSDVGYRLSAVGSRLSAAARRRSQGSRGLHRFEPFHVLLARLRSDECFSRTRQNALAARGVRELNVEIPFIHKSVLGCRLSVIGYRLSVRIYVEKMVLRQQQLFWRNPSLYLEQQDRNHVESYGER